MVEPFFIIQWQDGPIKEVGVNGCQATEILKEVKKYLDEVNVPPYENSETSLAVSCIVMAIRWLEKRTAERELRGVEGTARP